MNKNRQGYVFVDEKFAGIIREDAVGYVFSYDESYVDQNGKAVSLTLPLRKEEYKSKVLFSFFDGLIPEGWLLEVVKKNWKLSRDDRFGLLLVACRDCIGNVSIREEK